MNRRNRLRKKTFGHIEQEIAFYQDTKRRILVRREELMSRPVLENIGGGKSNIPGDPTGNMAVKLVMAYDEDTEIRAMQDIVDAIDYVYERCTTTERRLMQLYYWDKTLTLEGVSQRMHFSTRHLGRMRHEIAGRVARVLGWW